MAASSADAAAFAARLGIERDTVKAFLKILQQEQDALTKGEINLLLPLAEKKSGLVTELAKFAGQRNQFLASQGYTPDRKGMEGWLKDNHGSSMAGVWRELLETAGAAQQLNQTNGILINTRLAHNQQALSVLMSAANAAALYGPDGQPSAPGGGRQLGKV